MAEEVTRVLTIDGHRYAVAPGPDRSQYVVARESKQWWCFVRRDGDGNFVGSTAEGVAEAGVRRARHGRTLASKHHVRAGVSLRTTR